MTPIEIEKRESIVLCEGYRDRAFWAGWLVEKLGCVDPGLIRKKEREESHKSDPSESIINRGREIVTDPWNKKVDRGVFAYHSRQARFIRVIPCSGNTKILDRLKIALEGRNTRFLKHVVVCIDPDTEPSDENDATTGLRLQDLEYQLQLLKIATGSDVKNAIAIDDGATFIRLVRWEVADHPAEWLPNQQTLERIVCASIVAAYPERGRNVADWLKSRHEPPETSVKEYSWSFMAGWHAKHECDDFYKDIWRDEKIAAELERRLRASGAWKVAEILSDVAQETYKAVTPAPNP